MFVGILLMTISLVWIAFDKKKQLDGQEALQEKKDILVSAISDAELMVEELNNISDYLVSHIDKKRQEVADTIKEAEEKIKTSKDKTIKETIDKGIKERIDKEIKKVTDKKVKEIVDKEIKRAVDEKIKEIIDTEIKRIIEEKVNSKIDKVYFAELKEPLFDDKNAIFKNVLSEDSINKSLESKKKIVSANNKYKEVINLSQSGLNETQIAKKLNMGKGEIQLVLGINK